MLIPWWVILIVLSIQIVLAILAPRVLVVMLAIMLAIVVIMYVVPLLFDGLLALVGFLFSVPLERWLALVVLGIFGILLHKLDLLLEEQRWPWTRGLAFLGVCGFSFSGLAWYEPGGAWYLGLIALGCAVGFPALGIFLDTRARRCRG